MNQSRFCYEHNSQLGQALADWYTADPGARVGAHEREVLSGMVNDLFGYQLLQLGELGADMAHLAQCPIQRKTLVSHRAEAEQPGVILAEAQRLPVASDSIDAVILVHTLDFSSDPHQVLREADRSLIPDGHLVILGFNPRSIWGVRRILSGKHCQMPWDARFLSMTRIKDWLGLLGFDTLHSHYLFQRPPLQNPRLLDKLKIIDPPSGYGYMLFSAAYILVARKRTVILTPLKNGIKQQRPKLFPVGIPSSSQGNVRRVG